MFGIFDTLRESLARLGSGPEGKLSGTALENAASKFSKENAQIKVTFPICFMVCFKIK